MTGRRSKIFQKRAFFTGIKSLSSCYGYNDLIEVQIFAARERGVLSLQDQQCSYSADLRNFLENYKDRAGSTSIRQKIGNSKISPIFFYRPMMSNVVIFNSIDSKGYIEGCLTQLYAF